MGLSTIGATLGFELSILIDSYKNILECFEERVLQGVGQHGSAWSWWQVRYAGVIWFDFHVLQLLLNIFTQ